MSEPLTSGGPGSGPRGPCSGPEVCGQVGSPLGCPGQEAGLTVDGSGGSQRFHVGERGSIRSGETGEEPQDAGRVYAQGPPACPAPGGPVASPHFPLMRGACSQTEASGLGTGPWLTKQPSQPQPGAGL